MKRRTAASLAVAMSAAVLPATGMAKTISFHDANAGYHYYGGYNSLMYGQGAAVDPGNNVWNGFGKYQGPNTVGVFYGGGNTDSAHGVVPSANPGNPYAWYSGTTTSGPNLFVPSATPATSGFGNAYSDGTISPITLALSYTADNGVGSIGGATVPQGTPSKVLGEAALVSGSTLGTFTLGGVPAGTYNLFLYGANYDGDRGAVFNVSGGTAVGGFTAATNAGTGGAGSGLETFVLGTNYVEFTGITPDASGNISGTWGALANSITGQGGEGDFTGLQLQSAAVPEPASLGVLGVAAVGLFGRRRRA